MLAFPLILCTRFVTLFVLIYAGNQQLTVLIPVYATGLDDNDMSKAQVGIANSGVVFRKPMQHALNGPQPQG